ncbi:MAG: hypothetical protein LPK45_05130, partial [Bacteroidota bacterium]|nr:hypothetical protein [Bacteroidota bacterium]MDX5430443.1 hypothetical protein [Bacteroidota bacterium]MDX5469202.1 hypothetical protein [Bacteroidota bacterium]
RFEFTDKGPQTIRGNAGLLLDIPENAFQLEDGTPVSNDQVAFVLQEFPSFGSDLAHGLTTQSNGKMLESGGMFRMEAEYEGKKLKLREGKTIDVQLPSKAPLPGMSVFVGETNEQGDVVWVQTDRQFTPADTTKKPKLPLGDLTPRVLAYREALPPEVSYSASPLNLNIPKKPAAPRYPVKPKAPIKPVPPEMDKPLMGGLFNSEWRAYEAQLNRYEAAYKKHEAALERYDRKVQRYEKNRELYLQDSTRFIEDSTAWVLGIEQIILDRRAVFLQIKARYDAQRWNGALISLSKKMRDSTQIRSALMSDLNRICTYKLENTVYYQMIALERELAWLDGLKSPTFFANQKYFIRKGKIDPAYFQRNVHLGKLEEHQWSGDDTLMVGMIWKNYIYLNQRNTDAFMSDWRDMEQEIAKRKSALGIFDNVDFNNAYYAQIGNMGYINCDRFSQVPPNLMANLELETQENARVYVVVPRLNAVIPVYAGHQANSALSLPVGEIVKIVCLKVNDGQPRYFSREMVIKSTNEPVKLHPKPITMTELQRELDKL